MGKKQNLGFVAVVVLAVFMAIAGCHKNDGTQEVDAAAANGNLAPVGDTGGAAPVNESVAPAPALPIRLRPPGSPGSRLHSKRNSRSILPSSSNTRTSRRTRISNIKARSIAISPTRMTTRQPNMLLSHRPHCRNTSSRHARNQTICGRLVTGRMRRPAISGFLAFGSQLRTQGRYGRPATGVITGGVTDGIAVFGAATLATMVVSITATGMLAAAITGDIGTTTNSTITVGSRT